MSRIFDALRRSEQEKQPGAEPWIPVQAGSEPAIPSWTPDVDPLDLPYLEAAAVVPHTPDTQSEDEPAPRIQTGTRAERPLDRFPGAVPPGLQADTTLRSLAAEVLANTSTFAESQPLMGLRESQIDLSKLKVISVSSIPSPLVVALSSERSLGAEKFRVLGARLSNIRMGATLSVLQVTSSVVGEGKTLTSVNLAMTLATRFDQKVLLAEGDLRKPAVCALLGMENQAGIGEWWDGENVPISDYLLRIGDTGMCVLPAGQVAHPASVLQSPRIADLIADLARQFDWIIIDTPPLLPMADSNLWSRVSDGTLLVVRTGVVTRAALKKAVESIDNPKLVGVVLNDAADYDRVNYYDQYYTPRGDEASTRKAVAK
jgi:capsular exopolysaccharide synthesis family protein